MLGRHIRTLGRAELTGIPQAALPGLGLHQIFGCGPYPSNILGESWRSLCFLQNLRQQKTEDEPIWTNTVKVNAIEWPYESVAQAESRCWRMMSQLQENMRSTTAAWRHWRNVTTIAIGWYRMVSDIVPNGMMKTFTSDRGPPTLAMSFASSKLFYPPLI